MASKGIIEPGTTVKDLVWGPFGCSKEEIELQEGLYKKIVVQEMLPCVIGESAWKTKRKTAPFFEICKMSDEGFVLVVLENFDKTWSDLAAGKLERSVWKKTNTELVARGDDELSEDKKANVPKYSDGGAGADIQGWSKEGLKRFGELCHKVKEWRKRREYKAFGRKIHEEYKVRAADLAMRPVEKKSNIGTFKVFSEWDEEETDSVHGLVETDSNKEQESLEEMDDKETEERGLQMMTGAGFINEGINIGDDEDDDLYGAVTNREKV